jgi:hypothetical protein
MSNNDQTEVRARAEPHFPAYKPEIIPQGVFFSSVLRYEIWATYVVAI